MVLVIWLIENVAICDNIFRLCIPFICKDFIISIQLTDYPIVDNLEIEPSLLTINCGWSELYLY